MSLGCPKMAFLAQKARRTRHVYGGHTMFPRVFLLLNRSLAGAKTCSAHCAITRWRAYSLLYPMIQRHLLCATNGNETSARISIFPCVAAIFFLLFSFFLSAERAFDRNATRGGRQPIACVRFPPFRRTSACQGAAVALSLVADLRSGRTCARGATWPLPTMPVSHFLCGSQVLTITVCSCLSLSAP